MSTLRTNALEGMDAKNSITIVAGAGNITTTNMQEGLLKQWCNIKGTTTTEFLDSFNTSSLTDSATGKTYVYFTNNMNNALYSITTSAQENTCVHAHSAVNAGSYQAQSRGSDDQAFTDVTHFGCQIAGDLA